MLEIACSISFIMALSDYFQSRSRARIFGPLSKSFSLLYLPSCPREFDHLVPREHSGVSVDFNRGPPAANLNQETEEAFKDQEASCHAI